MYVLALMCTVYGRAWTMSRRLPRGERAVAR